MDLRDQLEAIGSKQDLQAFVLALRRDLLDHPEEWENETLDRFLESLAGWIGDMSGYFKNQHIEEPPQPDWRLVGRMLFAASTYE